MRIALIVAMDRNRVIGRGNELPWHLPADLAHFKRVTLGKPVLMGRRTFESIGRPLPGRHNIVVSGQPGYQAPGCTVVTDIEAGLDAAGGADELMVLGGSTLFEALLPRAGRLYLTLVETEVAGGDTWFPALDPSQWRETERTERDADDRNPFRLAFVTLERVRGEAV